MEYINTFKIVEKSDVMRNPPTILGYSEVKENLKRIFGFTDSLFEPHYIEYHPHRVECISINGPSFINVNFKWNNNYYHFLTESIPALLEINRKLPVVCQGSKFKLDMLKFFEIESGDGYGEMITMKYIECGNPSPQKIRLLRNVIEQKLVLKKQYGIIIKRSESYRSVINHDYLVKIAKNCYPIEWKIFDKLPVQDTAELFSKAAIIIAPHGAGLTNMLFSPRGITIIEFMPLHDPNVCYWHLSEMLGNKYYMLPYPTVNNNFIVDDRFISINDRVSQYSGCM